MSDLVNPKSEWRRRVEGLLVICMMFGLLLGVIAMVTYLTLPDPEIISSFEPGEFISPIGPINEIPDIDGEQRKILTTIFYSSI